MPIQEGRGGRIGNLQENAVLLYPQGDGGAGGPEDETRQMRRLRIALWILVFIWLVGEARAGSFCAEAALCGTPTEYMVVYIGGPGWSWQVEHIITDHEVGTWPRLYCWTPDMEDLPTGLVFIVFTAGNLAGESPTEHGFYPGEGYFPSPPCP